MGMLGNAFLIGFVVLSLVIAPAVCVLLIECLAALFYRRRQLTVDREPRIAVLIPAHDEQQTIESTLEGILPQVSADDRVVVIADNCSDDTASIARRLGAEVLERDNVNERGKGYALSYGIDYLRANPPDVVVVIDADTEVTPGTITAISREVAATGRPVQSINLLSPPESSSCRDQISSFAFRVRNLVRPLGQSVLAAPCQLMGTGMALPWEPLSKMQLASANIVEDLQLGIDFAVAGLPPRFSTSGKVTGVFPSCPNAATSQRKRWEHGHMATIFQQVPQLLWTAIRHRRLDILWLALDVAVPPLALVVVLWTALTVMGIVIGLLLQLWWPVLLALVLGIVLAVSIVTSWVRYARDIPIMALISVPYYVARKLPIYLAFLARRQVNWVRTERG